MNQARLNGEGLSPASGLPWLLLDLDLDLWKNRMVKKDMILDFF